MSDRSSDASRSSDLGRHLFLDDKDVLELERLKRVVNQPEPHPANPVLRPEKPWEMGGVSHYGTVLWDEAQQQFRMWYFTHAANTAKAPPVMMDGREWAPNRCLLCYATSKDGEHWDRPSLDQVDFVGCRQNNILRIGAVNVEGLAILHDPVDPDESRRYKAFWWEHGSGEVHTSEDGLVLWTEGEKDGIWVAFSPEGIHWTNAPENPVIQTYSDTGHYVVRDPSTGRYVAYGRFGHGRKIARTESEDYIHWSKPEIVLEPDEHEASGPWPETQFYGMTVDLYEDIYLGCLWVYRPGTDANIDTQLAVSRDGIHWNRVADRQTFLPVGPKGSWGDGMLRPAARFIVRGDEIFIYHGMVNGPHAGPKHPAEKIIRKFPPAVGLSTLRRDGFVSLDAGEAVGCLLTKPMRLDGRPLHLNIETGESGWASVSVCPKDSQTLDPAAEGACLPGFGRSERIITGGLDTVVRWTNANLRKLAGETCCLLIQLRDAKLYSFWFE